MGIIRTLAQGVGAFGVGVGIDRLDNAIGNARSACNPILPPPPPKPSGSGNAMLFRLANYMTPPSGGAKHAVAVGSSMSNADRAIKDRTVGDFSTKDISSRNFSTGNERLHLLARKVHGPSDNSVYKQGVINQFQFRKSALEKSATILRHPVDAAKEIRNVANTVVADLAAAHGALKVVSGSASITAEDGKRVVKAHVKEKINEVIEDLRNLSVAEAARSIYSGAAKSADISYAAATTTREGIKDFADAVQNRGKFEAGAALAGSSISLTAAVALGAVPHAAFKAASAAISVTYYMANGAKVSDAIRNIGGNGDKAPDKAASREIAEILREKSGLSGRSS